MDQYYTVDIAGMKRDLLRCPLNDELDIAAFIMFGDVELTVHAASELLKRMPEFDFIVTPEAKKKYFVARKRAKLYMKAPVTVNVRSITTDAVQTLILDGVDGEQIRGRKVVILDDVISTGESLRAMEELVSRFDCEIVAKAAVLAEGDAFKRDDITVLGYIPLIKK